MAEPMAEPSPSGLRSLLAHARRHWRAYSLGVLALAVVDLVDGVVAPWLQGAAFANLEREPDLRISCALIGAAFAAAALIQLGLRYAWRRWFIGTADKIGGELRAALFARIQALPAHRLERTPSGDLLSRMTNDLNDVRGASGMGLLLVADSALYLLFVLPQLIWLSPRLAAATALALPLVALLVRWGGRIVHQRGTVVQERLAALSAQLQETFSGARVVKAFAVEPREQARFEELARGYLTGQMNLARFQAGYSPSLGLVFDLAHLLAIGLGGREVLQGRLSLAELVVWLRAFDKVVWPMMAIGMVTGMLQRGAAAQARIDQVLAEEPDPAAQPPPPPPGEPGLQGALRVEGLTFRYPGSDPARPPVLQDVSFQAAPGTLLAIVGPVGAGKSTLLSLLTRLYDPPPGTVFLDGRDLLAVPPGALRRDLALVPQEAFLFSTTIADNVALGRQGQLAQETLEEACQAARVHEEVLALPAGYRALLGERGVNLSGGQRQRLTIARALARGPRVLLLDDALAAVDVETEGEISRAVRERLGPTRVVVTHRISAVREADHILVLDAGRIVERGTHEELLARGGLYARLARLERQESQAVAHG